MAESERSQERFDEQYARALRAFQSGDWASAIQDLEELIKQDPQDKRITDLLDEARFKAQLSGSQTIKARQVSVPWRRIVTIVLIVGAVSLGLWYGYKYVQERVIPAVTEAQGQQDLQNMLDEAQNYYESGDWDNAEELFNQYLEQDPGNEQATNTLAEIARQREIAALYAQAITLEEQGDLAGALAALTDISLTSPGYKDVSTRITSIRKEVELSDLFTQAEESYASGDATVALDLYEQLQTVNVDYEQDTVQSRLFDLYSQLGLEAVHAEEVSLADVSLALDYFGEALSIKPRDTEIVLEKSLATTFLSGWDYYQGGDWSNAYRQLETVYQQDAEYGGSLLQPALYESYIRAADTIAGQGDIYTAYELYRRASLLPGVDVTYATGLLVQIAPYITPSPTPTTTPVPSATPVPVYVPVATAIPTPKPISSYVGKIIFTGTSDDQTGYWVMDPDGSNLQYLGTWKSLTTDIETQRDAEMYSPDGRYHLFVRSISGIAQIFTTQPVHEVYGELPALQITRLSDLCYDPVWSPDGSRIAFVSEETGSDDIWVIYPDGSGAVNLTENSWPWDKRPSWSPDSSRIVFWSNRNGTSQIYVMGSDGRNVVQLTDFEDATDPLWVK